MPQYECAVVLVPTLTDDQVQEHTEMIKTWIAGLGAEIKSVDVWGRKRLAFPIRKQQEGVYLIYQFSLDQDRGRLTDLSRRASTTETILRHLVVRLPALKEPPRLPIEEEEEEAEEAEGGPPPEGTRPPEAEQAEPPKESVPEAPPKELADTTPENAPSPTE